MSTHQKKLRCAVYTRKSTEEGLDQEFNSLDAQREACVAFITSQTGLGWRFVADHYDDAGISGGTMERPALKRLLQDIGDRKVDAVVVYKIDRLTRSLMDFSRIVEVFDTNDVSFVSVTQQFNTTTSMGRLTLNVLLSFAQFEREVTAERIRDKIAASRKKGIWMGGRVPLGYRAIDRRLVIVAEADKVRSIFRRYLVLQSVPALADELNELAAEDSVTSGQCDGRPPFTRGKLYHMLSNVVYIGKAKHKDRIFDGEHAAIIDEATFRSVQSLLKGQTPNRRSGTNGKGHHLLTGLLLDETGDRLSPVFTIKSGKRYRYYISNRLERTTKKDPSGWRLPADELERTILHQLDAMLGDKVQLSQWAGMFTPSASVQAIVARAKTIREALKTSTPERIHSLRHLIRSIQVKRGEMVFRINAHVLIDHDITKRDSDDVDLPDRQPVNISVPMTLRRRGSEARLVLEANATVRHVDQGLIKTMAKAHLLLRMLTDGSGRTIAQVAEASSMHGEDVSRILPLAFLAPRITDAILRGRQPVELTARSLMRGDLPHSWSDQLQQLGI
ncbi:MAG: recombinase family protein [Mesorhizobium sp.]|nr:recombinase family protein [Mesorhizobium sp.]MBL8578142.1 recombinase family protein [Mesorhizobium sp.]